MKKLEVASLLKNVYRIFGDDALRIEQALALLETKAGLEMPELNKAQFNDENFDAQKIVLSCQQMPFVSPVRFVVVKSIAKLSASDQKVLEEYCQNPAPSTILAFVENAGGTTFSKLSAEKVSCSKLSAADLEKFVLSEFNKSKKTITPEAVTMLIEFCNFDLLQIQNSLCKLLFCSQNPVVPETVKQLVKKSDEYSVFEISTALTYAQGNKAIILMKKMLETMEFSVILGLISAHFRRMLYGALAEGSDADVASMLGVKEFAISKARRLAKTISPNKLLRISNLILNVDFDIKSGKMNAENAMYYLVFCIVDIIKG